MIIALNMYLGVALVFLIYNFLHLYATYPHRRFSDHFDTLIAAVLTAVIWPVVVVSRFMRD